MDCLADTRPSALHDVPLHTPPSQWEDIHDVNVDIQVTIPSPVLELPNRVIWLATRPLCI